MKTGKLPNTLLSKLIIEPVNRQSPPIKEVLAGPSIGEDCALLDFGGRHVLVSTDPITAAEDNIGKLLVTVCVNDVAASGGKPVGIMVTALVPPRASESDIKAVMDDLLSEASKQNIAVLGGHTEITDAVNRIVLAGTVLGSVEKGGFVRTNGALRGDKIVMTKSAGLEGSSILAHSFSAPLKRRFGLAFVERARRYSEMTSIVKEAQIAGAFGVSSMHDITEGGVLGALAEAAQACGLGFSVDLRRVKVTEETKNICGFFDISPYELISSGSLLICARDGDGLVSELLRNGIDAAVIGEVKGGESVLIDLDGERKPLIAPPADAIYDALSFESAKTVIFVCTGNTCRSPMAERFAKSLADKRHKGYLFASRGLCASNGASASENAMSVMKGKGIDISDFAAAALSEKDAESAFIILTMTESHKRTVLERYGAVAGLAERVQTLRQFAYGGNGDADIQDPFGLNVKAYEACAAEIEACVREALRKLTDNNSGEGHFKICSGGEDR